MLPDLPKTWLIVPCYNEVGRLPVEEFCRFVHHHRWLRLCLVNDGSSDDTQKLLCELAASASGQATTLSLPRNRGKGEAVRQGVLHVLPLGGADYVGYWDADLATPLAELPRLLAHVADYPQAEVLCACRLRRMGALIYRHWHRHVLGRVFATAASQILGLPFYDTQCGAKLFQVGLAAEIFAPPLLSSWCFDVELMARIVALRGIEGASQCIVEVPVLQWRDIGGSKLRWRHIAQAGIDLTRIFWQYRVRRTYADQCERS